MPLRTLIMAGGATRKFFDPGQPQFHPEDAALALEIDRYDFAMKNQPRRRPASRPQALGLDLRWETGPASGARHR